MQTAPAAERQLNVRSQGDDGIDARGPPRWKIRCEDQQLRRASLQLATGGTRVDTGQPSLRVEPQVTSRVTVAARLELEQIAHFDEDLLTHRKACQPGKADPCR
jgi:hypothetical protein